MLKIYITQEEILKDVKDGVLTVDGDVKFECSFSISASLKIAGNIDARDINAWNINAGNINARDINAWNINAGNINAGDINAGNINAGDILYYAFCCVYQSIKCVSIKAKRIIHKEPICLDGKIEYKNKEVETIKIGNNTYNKDEVENALKNIKSI